jgi:putative membrane protein
VTCPLAVRDITDIDLPGWSVRPQRRLGVNLDPDEGPADTVTTPLPGRLMTEAGWRVTCERGIVMHWGEMGTWGWAGALIWIAFMLIFFGALAAVIITALRRGSEPRTGGPEQILAERFARGEIDEDEYMQRRRGLRS